MLNCVRKHFKETYTLVGTRQTFPTHFGGRLLHYFLTLFVDEAEKTMDSPE